MVRPTSDQLPPQKRRRRNAIMPNSVEEEAIRQVADEFRQAEAVLAINNVTLDPEDTHSHPHSHSPLHQFHSFPLVEHQEDEEEEEDEDCEDVGDHLRLRLAEVEGEGDALNEQGRLLMTTCPLGSTSCNTGTSTGIAVADSGSDSSLVLTSVVDLTSSLFPVVPQLQSSQEGEGEQEDGTITVGDVYVHCISSRSDSSNSNSSSTHDNVNDGDEDDEKEGEGE